MEGDSAHIQGADAAGLTRGSSIRCAVSSGVRMQGTHKELDADECGGRAAVKVQPPQDEKDAEPDGGDLHHNEDDLVCELRSGAGERERERAAAAECELGSRPRFVMGGTGERERTCGMDCAHHRQQRQ